MNIYIYIFFTLIFDFVLKDVPETFCDVHKCGPERVKCSVFHTKVASILMLVHQNLVESEENFIRKVNLSNNGGRDLERIQISHLAPLEVSLSF